MKRRPASLSALAILFALGAGEMVAAPSGQSASDKPDSPLMLAVLHRDGAALVNLLAAHADPRYANAAGATALHFAVDDLAATQALLAAGADPNAADEDGVTPLALAAGREDGAAVVAALLAHGANAKTVGSLLGDGDPRAVAALLQHGANPRARAALQAAASRGLVENLRLLLDHGADLDGRDSFGRTALIWAAQMGHTEAVTLLLNRGADPDLQETFNGSTALMQAAASDRQSEAIVQALLAHGADVKLLDGEGANAETWALRSGQRAIAALLVAHGSPPGQTVVFSAKGERVGPANTVQQAVARAIPLLEQARPAFRKVAHCASCHQDALPAMALEAAQQHGFTVDAKARAHEALLTVSSLAPLRNAYREGIGFADIAESAYLLAGLAAGGWPRDSTTDAIARYLFLRQSPDGSWRAAMQRVPSDGSDVALTAMAIRALSVYGHSNQSIALARTWLLHTLPITNEELTFQALGLHWAGASATEVAPLVAKLISRQREDGGFAQREGMASDPYATSQAIVALREAGAMQNTQPPLQRAIHFLLERQLTDGSWFVATRALRFQPFFESGFPQGRSQFISAAATSWAVMALAGARP